MCLGCLLIMHHIEETLHNYWKVTIINIKKSITYSKFLRGTL